MDKTRNTNPDRDITREEYRGPSAFVTAMGQGFFDHLKWAGIGLALITPVAYFAPTQAKKFIACCRGVAEKWKATPLPHDAEMFDQVCVRFKRGFGNFTHVLFGEGKNSIQVSSIDPKHKSWLDHAIMNKEHGFGHIFTSHTVGIVPLIGKPFNKWLRNLPEHAANAVTVGGVAGLAGYIGGWGKAFFNGGAHAHEARAQFEDAKQEIRDQREINQALRKKYIDTKLELEDIKTTQAVKDNTLHVTKDNPPPKPRAGDGPMDMVPPPGAMNVRTPAEHGAGTKSHAELADHHTAKTDHSHTAQHADKVGHDGWKDKIAAQKSHAHEHESALV